MSAYPNLPDAVRGVAGDPLRVLMVGPALTVKGGVSAVEQLLVEFLPDDVKLEHVASMVQGTNAQGPDLRRCAGARVRGRRALRPADS